jgi:hypothetical protein
MLRRVRHKKTGNIYYILGTAINCTNKDDGQDMVVYTSETNENSLLFVREATEFNEKFETLPYKTGKDNG